MTCVYCVYFDCKHTCSQFTQNSTVMLMQTTTDSLTDMHMYFTAVASLDP